VSPLQSASIRIASRGSPLALAQARMVRDQLAAAHGIDPQAIEIRIVRTSGDVIQDRPLSEVGGKGLFTKEIEEALLAGTIDLAVHSLKDLPTGMPAGLAIAAIPEREDPRDAMVGARLTDLHNGARVGTSSSRRAAQLCRLRPDLQIEPVRGNVDTRLRKLKDGRYDAIVLAAAGLLRLNLREEIAEFLSPEQVCPAPGQGALAIQTREEDAAEGLFAALNDEATYQAVTCERAALAALGGGCQLPIGAFARVLEDQLEAMAIVISPDGRHQLRANATASRMEPEAVGRLVAEDLLRRGADRILAQSTLAEST